MREKPRACSSYTYVLACLVGIAGCGEPTATPPSGGSSGEKNIKTGDTAKGFGSEIPKGTDLGPPVADPNPPPPIKVR